MSKLASSPPPPVSETTPVSGKAPVRELLLMLGERRAEFLGFVRKRVRSGADAEDLLQQALIRAAEKLDGLRSCDRAEAWFYRILRNTIADHHAAWATREAKLELLAREASAASPEDAADCACSLGLLEDIRPEYAAIVRRIDIEGEPLADAAARLGITVGNAKVRLHRARKVLREELLRRCGTDSSRACQDCSCDDDKPLSSSEPV
jgi:RNA polymerase sigma factor (sigma-70 family)